MPRKKGSGMGLSRPFAIRVDENTEAFYRKKAKQHGISLTEYIRQTLVQGVIAENIQDVELRIQALISESRTLSKESKESEISDELQLAIYTCEAMLTAIVEARDVQALYDAQNSAKAKLKRLKGGKNGEA